MTEPRSNRESLLYPVLIPVGALVAIVAVLFLFSRILLHVNKTAATVTALTVATGVMVVSMIVVSRQRVTGSAMFSLFGGVLGIAMLAGGVALLVGQPKEEAKPVVLALVAPDKASVNGYATTTLSAPAGVSFTIAFDNQEPGVQHDVEIASGDPAQGGTVLVDTPVITGPAKTSYQIDPLKAGTYAFFCKIHPTTMKGTLTVTEGATPGFGGGSAEPITVVAKGLAFDPTSISLVASTPTTITFQNQDAGIPHNISIYTDSSASTNLFKGDLVTGPASTDYQVPALDPGTYFFRCDVHPTTMHGQVVVAGGVGGTPSASGAPATSSSPTPAVPASSTATGAGGGGSATATISASAIKFNTTTLTFASGQTITLTFDNKDAGIPHNFSIYTDSSGSTSLFKGDLVTGPASTDYQIPPLDPGTYMFRCDIHPATMVGTLTVT